MNRVGALCIVAGLAWAYPAAAQTTNADIDPASGLVKAGPWELVRANCSACHSTRLVTQQRANKTQWLDLIRWMQKEQNLWKMPPQIEASIVDYLATYYAAPKSQRRAALPPDQRPRNPYAPVTDESAGETNP